jgi:sulfur carrier protein ThiS
MSKKEQAAHINQQLQIGLAATYNALLAFKKYKNSPVIIARDGKIVAVPADKMPPATRVE